VVAERPKRLFHNVEKDVTKLRLEIIFLGYFRGKENVMK
jgi:hypothetical protein